MSKYKLISRGLVFALLLSLSSFSSSAQSQTSLPQPHHAPSDHEQFVAYWTTETGWHSELQLRNNLSGQSLTVTPALRLADGTETALTPVTINPQEVKSIDLDAAIAATAQQLLGTYGSIVLRYRSTSIGNLYAALMLHNIGHPIAFHIDASAELQNRDAASREGIWWLPNDSADGYLVLTNQGGNALQLGLSLYDASGKESKQNVLLGPSETNRYSIRKLVQAAGLTGSYGGIKVYAPAHAGSLDTLHFILDPKVGFSALLKMFDHDPNAKLEEHDFAQTSVWTLRAPMLALSHPDLALAFPVEVQLQPQLLIRNTTGNNVTAGLRFSWRGDYTTGKASGPSLQLRPYETRRIDIAALQDGKILPTDARWTSVTLTTDTKPDEVMAVATSYDASLQYGAQTPFSDQLAFGWEGGMWEYDAQHNSIITAGNGSTKPAQAAFTIFYNQGTQRYDLEQTLQPDDQMWIDIGKLIREQVPDKNGKTLPPGLTSGSYEFRDLTDKFIGSLFEGKVIYEKTYGHVTYGCANCCAYDNSPWLNFNPLNMAAGSTAPNTVWDLNCNGFGVDVSTKFNGRWSTANTSIATVDFYGTHTGVAAGSTTSNTSGYLIQQGTLKCPLVLLPAQGGANVKPTISGPNTLWWFSGLAGGGSGYANQITLTAASGGNGTSYQWAITAGSDKVTLSTGTSATVQVTSTGKSVTANDVSITVTVGGVTSDAFKLTVRAPYTLGTDAAHPNPVYLYDNTYIWQTQIYWIVLDNLLTALPSTVNVNEQWTTSAVPDYSGTTWRQPSANSLGCGTTNGAELKDEIFGEEPSRVPTPVYSANPNGAAVQHWGQEWRIGTCTTGSGPRVETNTLQKYTDHAAYTGVTTPAPEALRKVCSRSAQA